MVIVLAMERGRALSAWILLSIVMIGMGGCASLPNVKTPRETSYAYHFPDTSLSRAYAKQVADNRGKSGFMVLGTGMDAFVARTELFKKAEKSIDVQYYVVWDDLAGKLFYRSLVEAADRGVRVRILLDDLTLKKVTSRLAVIDRHPNIEIRVFNPLSRHYPRFVQYIFQYGKYSRRMHNKAVVIDNTMTIVGSRNIGNKYAGAKSERTDIIFSGMDVLGVGPVARMVSRSFDEYWNNRFSVKVSNLERPAKVPLEEIINHRDSELDKRYRKFLSGSRLVNKIRYDKLRFDWGYARVVADSPEKITQKIKRGGYLGATGLKSDLAKTADELLIVSPYLIPNGDEGMAFFREMRKKGVKITVVTNSYASTDNKIVNAHYAKYRKELLAMGVRLHEFKAKGNGASCCGDIRRLFTNSYRAGLHAKILTFDKKRTYVGAMNMDPRSIYENTELGVVITSARLSRKITHWFNGNLGDFAYQLGINGDRQLYWHDLKDGALVSTEPDTDFWDRLIMRILGALPIESAL